MRICFSVSFLLLLQDTFSVLLPAQTLNNQSFPFETPSSPHACAIDAQHYAQRVQSFDASMASSAQPSASSRSQWARSTRQVIPQAVQNLILESGGLDHDSNINKFRRADPRGIGLLSTDLLLLVLVVSAILIRASHIHVTTRDFGMLRVSTVERSGTC